MCNRSLRFTESDHSTSNEKRGRENENKREIGKEHVRGGEKKESNEVRKNRGIERKKK